MTAILTAVVTVVGVIGLANLLFLYGVTRRLRTLDQRVSSLDAPTGPQPGHRVGEFETTTLDGQRLATADLTGVESIVALLAVGCGACDKVVAELADVAGEVGGTALFVVIQAGMDEETGALVGAVSASAGPGARIAVVPYGPVSAAFDVAAFPTVMRIDDGVVRASGNSFAEVRGLARVG